MICNKTDSPVRGTLLPDVIAAPGTICLQHEWWLHPFIHLPDPAFQLLYKEHGPAARIALSCLESNGHFGWVVIHLMQTIHEHLGLGRDRGNVRRAIIDYLPGKEYFEEESSSAYSHFYAVVDSDQRDAGSYFSYSPPHSDSRKPK